MAKLKDALIEKAETGFDRIGPGFKNKQQEEDYYSGRTEQRNISFFSREQDRRIDERD